MKTKLLKFKNGEAIITEPDDGSNSIDVELGGKKPDKIEMIDIEKNKKIKAKLKRQNVLEEKKKKGRTIKI